MARITSSIRTWAGLGLLVMAGFGCGSEEPALPPEPDLEISEVALYQGLKLPLWGTDVVESDLPVISNRASLLRVFFEHRPDLAGCAVEGRLSWSSAPGEPQVFSRSANLNGASTEGALLTTLNFDIPPEAMTSAVEWSLEVGVRSPCFRAETVAPAQRIPATGTGTLNSQPTGVLNVTLVPFRYVTDDSEQLPDLSPTQLEIYRNLLLGMFPVEDVVLQVRAPVDWTQPFDGQYDGWGDLLSALIELRATDAPPDSTYYYGLIQPTGADTPFQGGIAGVAFVPDPLDVALRGGVGLGYPGSGSASVLAHELGHAMGRPHAPCGGPARPDEDFPTGREGSIGAWGYDRYNSTLYDPRDTKDFMSYCEPSWVSDFSFGALTERLDLVLGGSAFLSTPKLRMRLMTPHADGPRWSGPIETTLASGSPVAVRYFDANHTLIDEAEGSRLAVDHGEAMAWVPEAPPGTAFVEVGSGARRPWPKK